MLLLSVAFGYIFQWEKIFYNKYLGGVTWRGWNKRNLVSCRQSSCRPDMSCESYDRSLARKVCQKLIICSVVDCCLHLIVVVVVIIVDVAAVTMLVVAVVSTLQYILYWRVCVAMGVQVFFGAKHSQNIVIFLTKQLLKDVSFKGDTYIKSTVYFTLYQNMLFCWSVYVWKVRNEFRKFFMATCGSWEFPLATCHHEIGVCADWR